MFDFATLRRHLLGIIGLVFLLCGIGLLIVKGAGDSDWSVLASIGVRVGLTLCALWLAFPQLVNLSSRVPPWLLATIAIGGIVVVARPRTIFYVAPALLAIAVLQFVGWLFKPLPDSQTKKRKPTSKQRSNR